jgi:hypothetical protein
MAESAQHNVALWRRSHPLLAARALCPLRYTDRLADVRDIDADLPVPTKAMVPLGDLQTVYGRPRSAIQRKTSSCRPIPSEGTRRYHPICPNERFPGPGPEAYRETNQRRRQGKRG